LIKERGKLFHFSKKIVQNCNLYARNPSNKVNTITAQGRIDSYQNTDISITKSRVTVASYLNLVQSSIKTYLGRPWKQYSRTTFMKNYVDRLLNGERRLDGMEW